MKKYFYMAVAAVAALSSCSSEDAIFENNKQNEEAIEFTAVIEEGTETRATLDDNTPKWESTDEVNINGIVYTVAPESDASKATLTKKNSSDADPTGTFKAIYPASYSSGTGSSIVYTLPAVIEETWTNGQFNMPMYAEGTSTSLSFKNLCGVLKITVKSDQLANVKRIRVSSENKAVSGVFTVNSSNAAVLTDASTVTNNLIVTYTTAVPTTAAGVDFYVAVPAQDYQKLKIDLDGDGYGFTKCMTTTATSVSVERNHIYPITFAPNYFYVDLGLPSGLLWATYNVGATAPQESGQYFMWGGTTGYGNNTSDGFEFKFANYPLGSWKAYTKYSTHSDTGCNDGITKLESVDDAASVNWGDPWRMPTDGEWMELLTECTWTYTVVNSLPCMKVTGTNGNFIILPYTGNRINNTWSSMSSGGFYWASTLFSNSDDGSGDSFTVVNEGNNHSTSSRSIGNVVRAVRPS